MQKAIWKGILLPVSFYYAGRCHVCNEAECRWQSGRNGSLILTMINEQRWKMNYAPLLEGGIFSLKMLTSAASRRERERDGDEEGVGEGVCFFPHILCKVNTSLVPLLLYHFAALTDSAVP